MLPKSHGMKCLYYQVSHLTRGMDIRTLMETVARRWQPNTQHTLANPAPTALGDRHNEAADMQAGRQPGVVGSYFGKLQQKSVPGNANQFSSTEQLRHTTPMWMAPSDIIKPQDFKIWMDCSSFCLAKGCVHRQLQNTSVNSLAMTRVRAVPKLVLCPSWHHQWGTHSHSSGSSRTACLQSSPGALSSSLIWVLTNGIRAPASSQKLIHTTISQNCYWGLLSHSKWSDRAPHTPALLSFECHFLLL